MDDDDFSGQAWNLPEDDGLIFGVVLDGEGGATVGDWSLTNDWDKGDRPVWLHLDRTSPRVKAWLYEESGLTSITIEALLAEETRPRTFYGKRGTVAILRGVNANLGANPEDLVTLRIWCDGQRIITLRQTRLQAPRDVLSRLLEDRPGPETISGVFEQLIARLTERASVIINNFDDDLDSVELKITTLEPNAARKAIRATRQDIVTLRRYMAPQRDAISMLYAEPPLWIGEIDRLRLRETANRLMHYIESLDAARERALVLDDGIANELAERLNRNMYVLSVIAAIFLPLGFITGLLGINVGGIPFQESANGFLITGLALVVVISLEITIFRLLKWI